MKKLFFIPLLFVYSQVHAIVSSNTVWECNSTATAGNLNGGGFDSSYLAGVDGSQGADAILLVGDGVIGANANQVTSVATPFLSTHTGNVLHCTAGTGWNIAGPNSWHLITDVSLGVATLLDSAGTATSVGGVCKVGGAMSLNSTLDDDWFETIATSNTVHVKSGTYNFGEAVTIGTDAVLIPANFYGYKAIRGDNPTGTDRPLFDAGAGAFTSAGDLFNYYNFRIMVTVAGGFVSGANTIVSNVFARNTSATAGRVAIGGGAATKIIGGEFVSDNGTAINLTGATPNQIYGNYIHHSTIGIGVANNTTADRIGFNVFNMIVASSIHISALSPAPMIFQNTFYGSSTISGTGIYYQANTQLAGDPNFIFGNIFYGFSKALDRKLTGVADGWSPGIYMYNNYFNNTVNFSSNVAASTTNTFLDPQFTNPSIGDFRVGTNMKGISSPGTFGTTSSVGALDSGAVQRAESASAGGGGTRGFSFGY